TPPASKWSGGARNWPHIVNRLRALHRMRAVERSGEYRASENHSGCCSEGASAKLTAHNPRKQRENPATAGSGERFRGGKWRRGRDSNPRDSCPSAPLAGVCLRPLGHLSGVAGSSGSIGGWQAVLFEGGEKGNICGGGRRSARDALTRSGTILSS